MSKKTKRSALHCALEQLIMEDHEVYMQKGIATLMNGAVGVDIESTAPRAAAVLVLAENCAQSAVAANLRTNPAGFQLA